jgi:dUTP pyrophosphatase
LVEGLLDPKLQIGPNGIDLTVMTVSRFNGIGEIGFSSNDRIIPTATILEFDSGLLTLSQGAYKITYNEIVHVPLNIVAIARPRSSLLRCGVTAETAIWDSGYEGRSESLLLVFNPAGLKLHKNARVVQLLFFKATKRVRKGYEGVYQSENL